MRDYSEVSRTIAAVCEGETDAITKMATISCELFHAMEGFDWVGFYRVVEPELLKVGPYQAYRMHTSLLKVTGWVFPCEPTSDFIG